MKTKFEIDGKPSAALKNAITDEILKESNFDKIRCSQIIKNMVTAGISENEVKNAIKEMINQGHISFGLRRVKHKTIEKYQMLESQYIFLCHLVKFEDYEHEGDHFQIVRVRS